MEVVTSKPIERKEYFAEITLGHDAHKDLLRSQPKDLRSQPEDLRSQSKHSAPLNSEFQKGILYFLATVNFIVNIVLLWFVIRWSRQNNELPGRQERKLCVPGASLALRGDVTGLERQNHSSSVLYCGSVSVVLDNMIEQHAPTADTWNDFIDRPQSLSTDCEPPNPAVKVVEPTLNATGNHNRLSWRRVDVNRTQSGIDHDGVFLTIRKAGFYYVYAQVEFGDLQSTEDGGNMAFYIKKISGTTGKEMELLEWQRSGDNFLSQTEAKSSSFSGAVFDLEENDQIFVQVSHKSINPNERGNCFGAYMIP